MHKVRKKFIFIMASHPLLKTKQTLAKLVAV